MGVGISAAPCAFSERGFSIKQQEQIFRGKTYSGLTLYLFLKGRAPRLFGAGRAVSGFYVSDTS